MDYIMVAPVGDNVDALFPGIRAFPTEKVVLLVPKGAGKDADRLEKDLVRFRIKTRRIDIATPVWEEIFRTIAELSRSEDAGRLIINTATGDRATTCAATSAAFVNGLKAISVDGDEVMLLPVLKFSYYTLLTEKKMGLLKTLHRKPDGIPFEELRKTAKMSGSLLSYYIHGNLKTQGLITMGLIELVNDGTHPKIRLLMLGRLLVKGYL